METTIRFLVFLGALCSMPILLVIMKVQRARAQLSPGNFCTRFGLLFLLFSIFYGTGQHLFGWYNWNIYVVAVGIFWTAIGLVWTAVEIFVIDRRQSQKSIPPRQ